MFSVTPFHKDFSNLQKTELSTIIFLLSNLLERLFL